jgi:hypothetical protein
MPAVATIAMMLGLVQIETTVSFLAAAGRMGAEVCIQVAISGTTMSFSP